MTVRDPKFDTKFIVNRTKQVSLGFLVIVATIGFASHIFNGMMNGFSWTVIGLPMAIIGSLFLFFPPTEKWEYTAWQSLPQKVEQQNYGK